MKKDLYYVDAFTTEIFGGNPAGVVILKETLEENLMQRIARELNLSETVFVSRDSGNPHIFHTRFFTPTTEVDLCGHATIAAFYVLVNEGYIQGEGPAFHVKQRTRHQELPVEIIRKDGKIEVIMDQQPPESIGKVTDLARLSRIMGISAEDIGRTQWQDSFIELIPEVITTGLKDLIVPVKDLKELQRISIDEEGLCLLSKELDITGIHAFTLETLGENTAHCRNFAPLVGISEEAATGTASGALGYYLVKKKVLNLEEEQPIHLSFEQGDFMDRPSEIQCYIKKKDKTWDVKVGGKARIFIRGEVLTEE